MTRNQIRLLIQSNEPTISTNLLPNLMAKNDQDMVVSLESYYIPPTFYNFIDQTFNFVDSSAVVHNNQLLPDGSYDFANFAAILKPLLDTLDGVLTYTITLSALTGQIIITSSAPALFTLQFNAEQAALQTGSLGQILASSPAGVITFPVPALFVRTSHYIISSNIQVNDYKTFWNIPDLNSAQSSNPVHFLLPAVNQNGGILSQEYLGRYSAEKRTGYTFQNNLQLELRDVYGRLIDTNSHSWYVSILVEFIDR